MPVSTPFDFGFSASAWRRLAVAGAVVLVAGSLVLLVERPREQQPSAIASAEPSATTRRVRMESSFPVQSWTVSVAGRTGTASISDSGSWVGTVEGPAQAELLVIAQGAPGSAAQRCALRLVIDGDPAGERSIWGDGLVVATVRLPP